MFTTNNSYKSLRNKQFYDNKCKPDFVRFQTLRPQKRQHPRYCCTSQNVEQDQVLDPEPESLGLTFWEFAEIVNGRSAMQGFVWGAITEAVTGKGIKEQLITVNPVGGNGIVANDILAATSVIALVVLGTSFTSILPNKNLEAFGAKLTPKQFTSSVELFNGRVAMVGFLFLSLL